MRRLSGSPRSVFHHEHVIAENMAALAPVSPLLRWAGSKRKLTNRLVPFWHAVRGRYVEPFVGSGALFFALAPEAAVLSDLNGELIETYRTVRDHPSSVAAELKSFRRTEATYYRMRQQPPVALSPIRRAARFIFLNRLCFNGLYRTNGRGEFNVPYAPDKTGRLPDVASLATVAKLLARADLRCGDFAAVIEDVLLPGDFVYLDPPFAVDNRRLFRQYNATNFGVADLHRLADLLYAIDRLGAFFVLSYAVSHESLAAFRSWPHNRVLIQRNIAGFAAHRRRAAELLVTNIRL